MRCKYVNELITLRWYDDTYTPVDPTDASDAVQNSILTMVRDIIYMDGPSSKKLFMTWMEMKVLLI